MKKFIYTSLFLTSLSFAKTKQFEIFVNEISINNSIDGQPRKFTVMPEATQVVSKSIDSSGVITTVEMKVSDYNLKMKDGILVKLAVYREKNSDKKLISNIRLIVKSGDEAQVSEKPTEGEGTSIKASLKATRVE